VLLLVVGLSLVVLVGYLGYRAEKRRREAMLALAASRGWSFAETDDRWVGAFTGAPFERGHRRSARNVLTGRYDDRPFAAFDYRYYTTETSTDSEGRTSSREVSHTFSVVAVDVGCAFPALEVTPEGFFQRMVGRLVNRDIELESEEFNRAFTVTCPDRKFASDVLHPRMMEYLLQHREAAFRFAGTHLLVVSNGSADIAQIDATLGYVDGIADLVPEFVWRAAGGR
jgi:hypothetical protein